MKFQIVFTNFLLWVYLYGIWNIADEIVYTTLPFSVFCIFSGLVFIWFLRNPLPNKAAVEAVLGKDPLYDNGENDGFILKVISHRGAGLDAPENSLIAINMCAEKGCNGIEFDVTLTSDGIPVIFHDDTLERLTDSPAEIRRMTYNQLSEVDISVKHPLKDKFIGTRIPTLDATVQQCLNNKQKMIIDIKDYDARMIKVILDLFKKYPDLETKAVCSSFHPTIIYKIRRKNPKIVCSMAYRPHFFGYESYGLTGVGLPRSRSFLKQTALKFVDKLYSWAFPRIIYYLVGISIVLLHKDCISAEIINNWRGKGVRVMAWTVNHPVEKQHFSRILKITYLTDTLVGETSAHINNNARKTANN